MKDMPAPPRNRPYPMSTKGGNVSSTAKRYSYESNLEHLEVIEIASHCNIIHVDLIAEGGH